MQVLILSVSDMDRFWIASGKAPRPDPKQECSDRLPRGLSSREWVSVGVLPVVGVASKHLL